MHIDKERAIKAFRDYTANYDLENISVRLKIAHTYRVAEISERIAKSLAADTNIAWLLGLLHDIGRFEQVTRFGTFRDALSIDHAELGADILFTDNLFDTFGADSSQSVRTIAETAIRLHNKLTLPESLDSQTRRYSQILRDADKIDIFRVMTEPPYDKRELAGLTVRAEIMQCVREHKCVPRTQKHFQQVNELETLISQCCMAFDLQYNESRAIVVEQGYLKKLLEYDSEVLSIVRAEIIKTLQH